MSWKHGWTIKHSDKTCTWGNISPTSHHRPWCTVGYSAKVRGDVNSLEDFKAGMPERRASESTLSRKNLNSVQGRHFPGGSRFKQWGAIQVLFGTISQFIYLISALARLTPYPLCLFVWSQASLGYKGRRERERPTGNLRCVSQGWNSSGILWEKYKWSLFELCIAVWVVFNGTAIKNVIPAAMVPRRETLVIPWHFLQCHRNCFHN